MDTDAIIKQTRARFDHNRNKQQLKEKYEAKMLFAYAGGMWKAGPELLSTLAVCPDLDNVILEDEYGTPVKVDLEEFKGLVEMRWQEQMIGWLTEYEQLRRMR